MEQKNLAYQHSNFLEMSVVSEIKQKIEQIESRCKGQIGEDVVNERIRQLAYSKLLCQVYGKDNKYLIKAYTELGIAYMDIKFCQQSREHLLTALKLNNIKSQEDDSEAKTYQIKILANLAKSYLEEDKSLKEPSDEKELKKIEEEQKKLVETAIEISVRCLKYNQKVYGLDHISNADIYYIMAKGYTKLGNYSLAINSYQNILKIYEQIYGSSDKSAKIYMEIGQTYNYSNSYNDAIDNYKIAYDLWKTIISDNNYEVLFDISIKVADLYIKINNPLNAYDFMSKTDEEYSGFFEREDRDKLIYQKKIISICHILHDSDKLLEESLKLEVYNIYNFR